MKKNQENWYFNNAHMNKKWLLILTSTLFFSCGQVKDRECVVSPISLDGCCQGSTEIGPQTCNGGTYTLFEDNYVVCQNDDIDQRAICRK